MAACNHLTSYLPQFATTSIGDVTLNKVHDLTVNTYLNMDQSTLSFNITHNFTSEFNWNMNQLFVYLVATYNDTASKTNAVTLWDRIVSNNEEALLTANKLMVEYPLRDQFKELRGRDIRLHVRYRTMPITGVMHTKEAGSSGFKFGEKYFRDESAG